MIRLLLALLQAPAPRVQLSAPATIVVHDSAPAVALAYGTDGRLATAAKLSWTVRPVGVFSVTGIGTTQHTARLVGVAPGSAWVVVSWKRTTVPRITLFDSALVRIVPPLLMSESFGRYTTAQLRAACGTATSRIPIGAPFAGINRDASCSGTVSIDSGAVRYDWPAKPWDRSTPIATYCRKETTVAVMPRVVNPPALRDLWVSFTSMESPAFEHGAKECAGVVGLSYKFFLVELEDWTRHGRFGVYLQSVGLDPLSTRLFTDIESPKATTSGYGATIAPPGTSWGGAWHRWTLEMLNIGSDSTTFTVYMDGARVSSIVGPFFPGDAIGTGWKLTMAMGANINNGPDVPQARWFRNLVVSTTRIKP